MERVETKERISEISYNNYRREVGDVNKILIVIDNKEYTISECIASVMKSNFAYVNDSDSMESMWCCTQINCRIQCKLRDYFMNIKKIVERYAGQEMEFGESSILLSASSDRPCNILACLRVAQGGADILVEVAGKKVSLKHTLKKLSLLNTESGNRFNIADKVECEYKVSRNEVSSISVICFLSGIDIHDIVEQALSKK